MCEHACADAGVLADLDSPEDYEAALDRVDMDYPLPEECRALWDMQGLDEPLRDHCREVALVAPGCSRPRSMPDSRARDSFPKTWP